MQSIAQRVAQRTSLVTTARDIERVLSAVLANPDFWEIVSLADRPFNQVAETIKALEEMGWVTFQEGRVAVTEQGLSQCRKMSIPPRTLHRCASCDGRAISLNSFRDALARFEQIASSRPQPIEEFDQAFVTSATTMARLAIMADRGDLQGRRLLVLGDDDLVGIGAALTGLPSRVTVIEVDKRLVDFMSQASERESLGIEVVEHDLREPLPANLIGAFDTFMTDPPDTVPGLELFIARGLSSLSGPGGAGYFGMTMIESSLPKWRELQSILVGKYGVVITDIIDDFSVYVNWEYLPNTVRDDLEPVKTRPRRPWYTSSLYRVETLADSAMVEGTPATDEGLYVGPESLLWTRGMRSAPGT